MTKTEKILWPVAAISVGLLVAITTQRGPNMPEASPQTLDPVMPKTNAQLTQQQAQPMPNQATEKPDTTTLRGVVLEVITVPNYVYLRVGEKGSAGTWTAVNSADVNVGQQVVVRDAQLMENFTSNTLKRTFDRIYFGVLADSSDTGKPGPQVLSPENPHRGSELGQAPISPGHSGASEDYQATSDSPQNPHAAPTAAGDNVAIGKVEKAKGARGRKIQEIFAQREKLIGALVRVRGVVVKVTPKVMGHTFLHLRDGSGKKDQDNFDLTITTDLTPAVGATVLFEGVVKTDVDLGSGYSYKVLLENAREVTE